MPETAVDDPHQWLEEIEGAEALDQVKAWNAATVSALEADPRYKSFYADALAIAEASDKIPYGAYRSGAVYNFWQDETHIRGLLRRTSLENYLSDAPAWETLLSIDALAKADGENWVYKGSTCLPPDYAHCMLTLSRGGLDASERREWSHADKAFVEGGFFLPEAKAGLAWLTANELLVATDWGEGTMTASGYPFVVKRLARGQALADAREALRGKPEDVGVWPARIETETAVEALAVQSLDFHERAYWRLPEGADPIALDLPRRSTLLEWFSGEIVFSLEEDWTPEPGGPAYERGALLSMPWEDVAAGGRGRIRVVHAPGPRESLGSVTRTKSRLLVVIYENVRGFAYAYDFDGERWNRKRLGLPEHGAVDVASAYRDSDVAFFNAESFLQPSTLIALDVATGEEIGAKALPARFSADGLSVDQHEAAAPDGERIPYFLVRRADAPRNGETPTLLYGYGGFEISMTPSYSGIRGKLWLERGGAFALANIRGGGEFGPAWHQAALKTKRQTAFDDMIAVAEDLVGSDFTSPRRLGVMGGSNGGLLVGALYVQRPDLFQAVVCQVPLLDMLRYHKLLAGASWVGEYGHPDIPSERAHLERISPYHNVRRDREYPEIFFVTSTKDDRVHPGHARKMAALLEAQGHPFRYYENIDGGHSAAANLREVARRTALEFTWLSQKLMD